MTPVNIPRHVLEQAAADFGQAASQLADVQCLIDGRRASFAATGPKWEAHPDIPRTEVRYHEPPAGAHYHMLEVRSLAGASAQRVVMSHAADMHVLSGTVAIQREEGQQPEYYGPTSCATFAAGEPHGFEVLQDAHNMVIIHFSPPFCKPNGKH